MDKFKFEQTAKGGALYIKLSGQINEDTVFPLPTTANGNIIFNFSKVSYINSLGLRVWVNYLKNLQNYSISIEECPPQIVRQIVMTPSFVLNAKVLSVYVSYSCDDCNAKKTVLVSKKDWEKNDNQIIQKMHCDKCNQDTLEIDGDTQQYLSFWGN